jgi:hypothetical protein
MVHCKTGDWMMQYKITRQYARDIEMPMAEFDNVAEAKFFVKIKLESDSALHVAAIYRLYHNKELLDEINRNKITVSGVPEWYLSPKGPQSIHPNAYQVAVQDLVNAPTVCANFIELKDARLFIEKKLPLDLAANKKMTYRILKSNELLEKFNPLNPQDNKTNKQATFRPTPFNTVPRPGSFSQRWLKEKAEEEKEKEK